MENYCYLIPCMILLISGSPFQFTVGPIAGGGAHKVHAAGQGLVGGEVNQPGQYSKNITKPS